MVNAVLQIVRGGTQAIDLATVTTPVETVYMFVSLTWGLIADVDIESEKVRFLGGEIRDTLGALKCIIQKRAYHGRISYLPAVKKEQESPHASENGPKENSPKENGPEESGRLESDNESGQCLNEDSNPSEAQSDSTTGNVPDQQSNAVKEDNLPTTTSEAQSDSTAGDAPNGQQLKEDSPATGTHTDVTTENSQQSNADKEDTTLPVATLSEAQNDTTPLAGGEEEAVPSSLPSTSIIPPLTEPVASDKGWVTVEGNFVSVHVGMTPLLTNKFIGHPHALLGAGHFYIVYANDDISRREMFQIMLAMDSGGHINHRKMTVVSARACRIEPMVATGRLVVDGEEINYGPIQLEVNKSMTVFSRKNAVSPHQ